MADQEYALLFLEGDRTGDAVPLAEAEFTLGRSRSNNLTFDDELISRKHLVFRRTGDDIMLEDLDSAHGTFLNDKRLRGILSLSLGDIIQVGSQKIKLVPQSEVAAVAEQTMRELDAIDQAAQEVEAEAEELDKTRFGGEEDADETRYQPMQAVRYDEDEEAKTRVLDDMSTRMLDMDELQGLKSGKGDGGLRKRIILGSVLVVLLLAGAGAGVGYFLTRETADPNARTSYTDDQYGFRLRVPAIWQRTGADRDAVITFELDEEGAETAYCKVYANQSVDNEVTGITTGFEAFKEDTLAARHSGLRLKGSKRLDLNGIRMIQYGFASDTHQGFGVFTLSNLSRYDIEVGVVNERYQEHKGLLLSILESFRLEEQQVAIDFPLPDEEVHRMSLAEPDRLVELAERDVQIAQDLMGSRDVRTDNLYRCVMHYRSALQKAAALSTPPEFYESAARKLSKATQELNAEVRNQKFQITAAEKIGDWERAEWELSKLMNLIPDRNDPVYREAKEHMKRYQ